MVVSAIDVAKEVVVKPLSDCSSPKAVLRSELVLFGVFALLGKDDAKVFRYYMPDVVGFVRSGIDRLREVEPLVVTRRVTNCS